MTNVDFQLLPFAKKTKNSLLLFILIIAICSCARWRSNLPPILASSELNRPYIPIGKIEVSREVYFHIDYNPTPSIMQWGNEAVRKEALKMGADAVIYPTVTGKSFYFLFIPATEYRATGEAIKFR